MSDPLPAMRPTRLDDAALRRMFAIEPAHGSVGSSVGSSVRPSRRIGLAGASAVRRRPSARAAAALFCATAVSLQTADFLAADLRLARSLPPARPFLRAEESQMQAIGRMFIAAGVLGLGVGAASQVALADAEIVAWGYNGSGQTNAPTGAFRAVAVGGNFFTGYSLGVRADGSIAHWGSGVASGLPAGTFIDVAGCNLSACALRSNGTLAWWGTNESGLANVPSGSFIDVDGASNNFAARRGDGSWVVWGVNQHGQASNTPTEPLDEFKVGPGYMLARRMSGEIIMWGYIPAGVGAIPKGVQRSLWPAHGHVAALRADGTAVCWGRNTDGECNAPTGTFRQIATGGETRGFTIGLRPDGTLVSWGYNGNGEQNVPSAPVDRIVVGQFHGIGLVADPCPGDITNNGVVDAIDLAVILTSWGTAGGGEFDADANRDGMVDAQDLALVLGSWGSCSG